MLPLLLSAALLQSSLSTHPPRRLEFETEDGMRIAGLLHAVSKNAPTVLLLPMYLHTKESFAPLVPELRGFGLNSLALDLRGHGESAPDLARRVRERDASVFRAMHLDVEAAVAALERRGFDTTRLALLGASVGCSVSVATLARKPAPFRAAVLMTPGARYLGVDTLADAKHWPGIPLLILSSEEEAPRVRKVAEALAGPRTTYRVVPGSGRHGTRMFGKVPGIEKEIARFLHGCFFPETRLLVPRYRAGEGGRGLGDSGGSRRTLRLRRAAGRTTFTLITYLKEKTFVLGAGVEGVFRGEVRWTLGIRSIRFRLDTSAPPSNPHSLEVDRAEGLPPPRASEDSFRGARRVLVKLDAGAWFDSPGPAVSLEFLPASKKRPGIRFPAKGRYLLEAIDRAPSGGTASRPSSSRPSRRR